MSLTGWDHSCGISASRPPRICQAVRCGAPWIGEKEQMKTALANLLFLLVLTSVQVIAQTKHIKIGELRYSFDAVQSDGSVQSAFEMLLDTSGITTDPIPFSNATMFVGASNQG